MIEIYKLIGDKSNEDHYHYYISIKETDLEKFINEVPEELKFKLYKKDFES